MLVKFRYGGYSVSLDPGFIVAVYAEDDEDDEDAAVTTLTTRDGEEFRIDGTVDEATNKINAELKRLEPILAQGRVLEL